MKIESCEAIVNGGCLFFFETGKVVQAHDVLDSLLYTQLAASKKHPDKGVDFDKWKDVWLAAALRFGWVLNTSESFSQRPSGVPGATLWDWIKSANTLLIPQLSVDKAEGAARHCYEAYPQQRAIKLLADQTLSVDPVALELVPAPLDAKPEPVATRVALQLAFVGPAANELVLVQIHFTTLQALTPAFLFEPIDPLKVVGNVELGFYSMRLVDAIYSQFREKFDVALKEKRPLFIEPLKGVPDVQS
ncbi:hypothetical protein YA0002_15260 [Pseudomonas cichorii]|uniref:hypothetical protein n=1 Tax=Pseudomonas cichorii TaxID=36746 RepID=UPI0018E648ED|nr:hypothetical protein [Pseudomonas cichorii]MBI6854134.1 hypothetical protein [Pseudomonas cichorii]